MYARKGKQCKELPNLQIILCYLKNPIKCSACVVSLKIVIECGIDFLEIHLFFKSHSLEFHEIWHKNTLGNK